MAPNASTPERLTAFRERIRDALLTQLTEAVAAFPNLDQLRNPVLQLEVFIEDRTENENGRHRAEGEQLITTVGGTPAPCSCPQSIFSSSQI